MKFVFFLFPRTEKIDSVMKGLMGEMPPHNFWARTAPGVHRANVCAIAENVNTQRDCRHVVDIVSCCAIMYSSPQCSDCLLSTDSGWWSAESSWRMLRHVRRRSEHSSCSRNCWCQRQSTCLVDLCMPVDLRCHPDSKTFASRLRPLLQLTCEIKH